MATATAPTLPASDTDRTAAVPITRPDKHLWGIYIVLCLISIVELYSASSREVRISGIGVFEPIIRHLTMLFMGFLIILGLQRLHYRRFYYPVWIVVVLSVLAMVYTMFFGDVINGARRSFSIAFMSIQPAELLKLSAVLATAWIAQHEQLKGGGVSDRGVIRMAAIVLLFGALLVRQGLTNTILLMCISLSMFIICGVQWRKWLIVVGIYAVMAGGSYAITHHSKSDDTNIENTENIDRRGTWDKRIERFKGNGVPKYKEPVDANNRQEMYSYMAQANGHIKGVGPGNSRETSRLPLAFSDYIFAIIVEEWGLIGGLALLVVYLWLLTRASVIAAKCTRAFPAFLVLGMAVMIVFQALFHIGIVTGFFPVSGQPLPLISKGGSSILVTSVAFGIMLSVSRHTARSGNSRELRRELDQLPKELQNLNPTQL